MKCTCCGNELEGEDLEDPLKDEHGDELCYECWSQECCSACSTCEDWVENTELEAKPGEILAIFDEEEAGLPPGYYRVLEWPFYSSDMFGMDLYNDALEFVIALDDKGLDAASRSNYAMGMMCEACRTRVEALLKGGC